MPQNTFDQKSNIVLIGMPGAGKSTVGVYLAKYVAKSFLDSDISIQTRENRTLQEIMDAEGYMKLRQIEEEVLLSLNVKNHIVATGGSVPYSDKAMQHLREDGAIIFLDVTLQTLRDRICDFDTRGIAKRDDQSFEDLFQERFELYSKYADLAIDCNALSQEQITWTIKKALVL